MEIQPVSVKIYIENYLLRTEAPEEEVRAIAAMVDAKMQELAASKQITSTEKAAVWAALDLAAELRQLRRDYQRLLAAARER